MCIQFEIEKFLRRSAMSASRFGRLAAGDPRFVHDLRRGRVPTARTITKIAAFIAAQDASR